MQFFQAGKITSAVCHGPAAIVGATDANGVSIFKGRKATGFSDLEEVQVDKVKDVPFLLETRIKELGGAYEKAKDPWAVSLHAVPITFARQKLTGSFAAARRFRWYSHHRPEPCLGTADRRGHRQSSFFCMNGARVAEADSRVHIL